MEIERKMRYTQCDSRLLPALLEKSCKGEHRQQEEGRKSENFHVGLAKGLCLPLGSPEPPPLTLHATRPLWGWETVFPLCICGCEGSLQAAGPGDQALSPGGSVLQTVSTLLSCSWPVNLAKPLGLFYWGFSLHHCLSGALWTVSQYLWGSHRAPYSEGLSSTLAPPPIFPMALFFTVAFSYHRYWSNSWESL